MFRIGSSILDDLGQRATVACVFESKGVQYATLAYPRQRPRRVKLSDLRAVRGRQWRASRLAKLDQAAVERAERLGLSVKVVQQQWGQG